MKKILLTGATGQLGSEFNAISNEFSMFDWHLTDRKLLNLLDHSAVVKFFQNHEIDYCINCAGYTNVNLAESEPELAYALNVDGVQYLAIACQEKNIPFIHFSTDYVYHLDQNRPLLETDPTKPQNIYAKSKFAGELIALEYHPLTMVIRTSWLYSGFGTNFLKSILESAKTKERLTVVFDQIGTPTYARDLARAVLKIITYVEDENLDPSTMMGIFNYSNEGVCSWYDFARSIVKYARIPCPVIPIETQDYPSPAIRPHYSVLNKKKIKMHFGLKIPHWEDALERCMGEIED